MHPAAASRLVYSPDLRAESSFPERHFTPYDDEKAVYSGFEPGPLQSALTKRHIFEPSLAPLCFQGRSSWSQAFPRPNHIVPSYGSVVDHNNGISIRYPTTVPSLRPEWALSSGKQSASGLFWQPAHAELGVEDDSDSNQGPNDSPEEFCPLLPTWPTAQNASRRSMHRVAKQTKVPAPILLTRHTAARSDRRHATDSGCSVDWLDGSGVAAAFLPQTNDDNPASGGAEIDLTFHDGSSSPSKVDSKRIAHKLSEKSRRNRLTIAIREIQRLLPSEEDTEDQSASWSLKEADFVVRPGVPSSKLDVVEMAVDFIKDLRERNRQLKRGIKEAERKLEECQCRWSNRKTVAEPASSPETTRVAAG